MMDSPGYYAIIPATIRYDDTICANAKLLYGEITSLCNKRGYCYATNTYFSELYRVNKVSISRWINQLIEQKYITSKIEYIDNTKEIKRRILCLNDSYPPINKIVNTPYQNCYDPINKIVKENNKEEYIKEINKEKFKKPTIEEVKSYCLERKNKIDPQAFIDYYETVGWIIGKGKPMKNWRAAVRTWERNNNSSKGGTIYESI